MDGHTQVATLLTDVDASTGALTARGCHGTNIGGGSCLFAGCNSLWEGSVVGNQMSLTMVNHTSPCAIGDPGQNRLYGCEVTATLSSVPRSRSVRAPRGGGPEPTHDFRLVGGGDADFFSCRGFETGFTTTFELTTPDLSGLAD